MVVMMMWSLKNLIHAMFFRASREIAQGRPATQRRRHRQVRNEQQGPDDREEPPLFPRRRIDPAAVGKVAADHRIVDADQPREQADGEDDRKGREPREGEGEADDVSLARTPIAVEQRGGALPVYVAWAIGISGDHREVARKGRATICRPSRITSIVFAALAGRSSR